jgi:hypothetical protein
MAKKKINWKSALITGITIVILGIIFTLDDVTGIGEVADPLEFVITGATAYFMNKYLK